MEFHFDAVELNTISLRQPDSTFPPPTYFPRVCTPLQLVLLRFPLSALPSQVVFNYCARPTPHLGQINWHIFTHKHKLATPGNKENIWKNTRVLLFAISGRGDAFLGSFHKYGQHVAQLNCQLEAVGESQERESGRERERGREL